MAAALTAAQLAALNVLTKVSASFGFVGVLSMGVMHWRYPATFQNPTGRLILAIAVADLIDCTVKFMGRWGPEAGVNSWLCQLQGAGIQESNFSSVLLGLVMALNALYISFFKGSTDSILRYEPYLISACFIIPLPFAIAPIIAQPDPGFRMYGDVDQWCWIVRRYGIYQIYLWFMILWAIFAVNLVAFGLTRWSLRKTASELVNSQPTSRASQYRMFILRRMLAYMLAFVIVWTPSTLNRIVQLSVGLPVFGLSVIQSLISPSRGMINFMAFFYNWWYQPSAPSRKPTQTTSGSSHTGGKSSRKGSATPNDILAANQKRIAASKAMQDDEGGERDYQSYSMSTRNTQDTDFSDLKKSRPKETILSDATIDMVKSADGLHSAQGGRDGSASQLSGRTSMDPLGNSGNSSAFHASIAHLGSSDFATSVDGLLSSSGAAGGRAGDRAATHRVIVEEDAEEDGKSPEQKV